MRLASPFGALEAQLVDGALLSLRFVEEEPGEALPTLEEFLQEKTPSLAPRGTAFQKRVWRRVLEIPRGETVTYGQLAKELGTSPRAIGRAVAANPILILIPCHRVVAAGGAPGGYAGGQARKAALLAWEKQWPN